MDDKEEATWLKTLGFSCLSESDESDMNNNLLDEANRSEVNAAVDSILDHVEFDADKTEELSNIGEITVSTSARFDCGICGKTFTQNSSLKRHLNIHSSDPEHFKCRFCDKTFLNKQRMMDHEKGHTKPRYKCTQCSKDFKTKLGQQRHEKSQHEKIFKMFCEVCGKGFNYSSNLRDHRDTHRPNKIYECKVCSKTLKSYRNFRRHMSTCEKPENVKCCTCGKAFKAKRYLKEHIKSHDRTSEWHQCTTCGKTFSHHSTYYRHRKNSGH